MDSRRAEKTTTTTELTSADDVSAHNPLQRYHHSTHGQTAQFTTKLECVPMPNVMVALPNTGGALCSTPQSLADDHY